MYLPRTLIRLNKFGRLPLTGEDLLDLCSLNGVEIILSPEASRGFYYFADNTQTMVLSTRLSAAERRFVGWHEFAHFLQNFYTRKPIAAFSNVQPDKASEKLADVFAAIAVNPDRVTICRPLEFVDMILRNETGS
jgi:Zn-dependent peptidase ImmA (M78 family)